MTTGKSEIELRREFDAVVRRYRSEIYRYAFWLGRDRQRAEDVVQEALLRAWKSWGSLRDASAAKQWLVSIVRREHARQFERKQLEIVDLADFEAQIEATGEDPELDDMRRAIFRLEADYREPLVLQVLMGCTAKEISALTGLKTGAVLTRLHRARAKLRAEMGFEQTDEGQDSTEQQ